MKIFDSIFNSIPSTQSQIKQIPQGDSVRGKKIFQNQCADCHYLNRNDNDLQAPTLGSLMGRKTGSTSYRASSALRRANFKWNQQHLFKFLRNPQRYIPGNTMVWPGMKGLQQRADLIAFLKKH